MSNERYPVETLDADYDDGTMVENVNDLREEVVGHRIVRAEKVKLKSNPRSYWPASREVFEIELDNGKKVQLANTDDCCAYTELEAFLAHPEMVNHIVTGVGTTDDYTTWHIYADMGDVLKLTVGWSSGNPFYYGYGFEIKVVAP